MSCLHNQRLAGRAAKATGIARRSSHKVYLTGISPQSQLTLPADPTVRQVAGVVLRYNLHRRYEWMVLTGRDPRMDKSDIAAMMAGTAIATAIILVRLKRRERRLRGRLDG